MDHHDSMILVVDTSPFSYLDAKNGLGSTRCLLLMCTSMTELDIARYAWLISDLCYVDAGDGKLRFGAEDRPFGMYPCCMFTDVCLNFN